MPQYLKPHIKELIAQAALRVFASKGVTRSTMAEISANAGISTGNIYRYFKNKEVLFDYVVPPELASDLTDLLARRVQALKGIDDIRSLSPEASYSRLVEKLMIFAVRNRLALVILIGRAEGTKYAHFGEQTVELLSNLALDHARSAFSPIEVTAELQFVITEIFTNLIRLIVRILARFEAEADIRSAIEHLTRYHITGLKALFSTEPDLLGGAP